VFINYENIVFFGTWKAPDILQTQPSTIHVVQADEIRRPDLISFRVYNDPNLFWAIAIRNLILMPLKDIEVGQSLVCPHINDISSALAASSETTVGTT
jgi:hypothetical protein